MLIQRNPSAPEPGDIVAFRLVSGEEIVGKLSTQASNGSTITSPLILGMVGPNQLAFGPFMTSVDDNITIFFANDKLLVAPIKARDDVANNYRQLTTGISVPSASETSAILRV